MGKRMGGEEIGARNAEPRSRKPWVAPAIHEMSAGSAEDGKGKPPGDVTNPS